MKIIYSSAAINDLNWAEGGQGGLLIRLDQSPAVFEPDNSNLNRIPCFGTESAVE